MRRPEVTDTSKNTPPLLQTILLPASRSVERLSFLAHPVFAYIVGFGEQRRQDIQSETRRGKRSPKVVAANRVVEVTGPQRHAQSGRVGGVCRFEASSMANGRARRRPGCAAHILMLVAPKRNTPGPKGRNAYPGESPQEPNEVFLVGYESLAVDCRCVSAARRGAGR